MKRIPWIFLFVCSMLFLLASGKFPPPPVLPKQPSLPNGGRAAAIAVHPGNENIILVASESGGLFRSTNHGANWTYVSGSSTFGFNDVTYLPYNANVVLATAYSDTRVVSGGGIWRSTDGGSSWSQVALNPPSCNYSYIFGGTGFFAETGRDRVWASTNCGSAYSDDQGASWQFLPEGSGYKHEPQFAILAPAAGHILIRTYAGLQISTDDGSTWSLSTPPLPQFSSISSGAPNQIAAAPTDPTHLYWAFNYYHNGPHVALYRSSDNGATWSAIFDVPGTNRPPFVVTAQALSGDSNAHDIYYSNGACALQRATVFGRGSIISSWILLGMDHCDPADIGFSNDHRTPILLATDGGLHNTANNGLTWTFVGGGQAGYNALQITEVTGQLHNDGLSADLYFGTQDNSIWASPDEGASWTAAYGGEGVHLNIPRDFYPANQTNLTGQVCMPCSNFISGPLLTNLANFSNAPDYYSAPRLLQPGYYIQETTVQNSNDSYFALTTNTGGAWTTRYSFPERAWDRPRAAGPMNDPVLYTAIKTAGVTSDNNPIVELKRVADVLGNGTPLVSNVSGFGSLGLYGNMMVNYVSFGVDPNDPNYLMVSDVVDKQVKVSTDGGATWTPDLYLTDLVTQSGELKFTYLWGFSQSSAFAFDPECNGHIMVGTQQAGVFETFDRGGTWQRLSHSEEVPNISSIFFAGNGRVVISSYGRGLWKSSYVCPPKPINIPKPILFAEPIIFWKGARVPISEIHDPDACPACGYFLLTGGKVLDYKTAPGTDELVEVMVSEGEIRGYDWQGVELPVPFQVTKGHAGGGSGVDKQLKGFLTGGIQIKGLFMEGNTLRGLILAADDLSVDQLPKKFLRGPHISLSPRGPRPIDEAEPITVTGVGFDPALPLEVLLDGQPVQPDSPPDFDPQGNFTFLITPQVGFGVHTILVRQGEVQDIGLFAVTVHETD
jgi:photosystem II stability/assembly factor-like uncharacterized protein